MPRQSTKTLGDFNVSTDTLRQGFASLAGNKPELNDLGIIFAETLNLILGNNPYFLILS